MRSCRKISVSTAPLTPPPETIQGHELHLYLSKSNAWTMKRARLQNPRFEEPARLGRSLEGHSGLRRALSPVLLRFIPLPWRLPGNTSEHLGPWKFLDVACANGSLKLVEIEHFQIVQPVREKTAAMYDLPDTIYDDNDPHSMGRKDDDHVDVHHMEQSAF